MKRPITDGAYRKYLLTLLMALQGFNNVDRLVLGVVLQDIKQAFSLSDTQLGFLSGIAFAAFYSVMGIPIARWADRGNRVTIISVTTALWGAMVALSGAAASFLQLVLIRVGVAVGEAGLVPPAHSLIADYFQRDERPRAVAHYMLGVPLALTAGYFLAGWLNEFVGWRVTFMLVGAPGLLLAALSWFTMREPRDPKTGRVQGIGTSAARLTESSDKGSSSVALEEVLPEQQSLRAALWTLWRSPAFRHLLICFSVWYFFGYGILQWEPTYFIRAFGMGTGEVGTWFAVIYGVVGSVSVYYGGVLCERYAAGNERLQLNFCAAAFVLFAVATAATFLVASERLALILLAVSTLSNVCQGPIYATLQTLVPPRMRAISIALVQLFANLIGMGLGPLAVGVLSDSLRRWVGDQSLRYALVILCPGYVWAAWHLWRAGGTVAREVTAQTRCVDRSVADDSFRQKGPSEGSHTGTTQFYVRNS